MWKYIAGVSNPSKHKVDKKEHDKDYDDTKRSRSFQSAWLRTFPWVRFDSEQSLMFCKVCEKHSSKSDSSFVKGCNSLRKGNLESHSSSMQHKQNCDIEEASKKPAGESEAEKALMKMNSEAHNKLCILFRNTHALAKHERPFTDFIWICNLDEAKGLKVGDRYRSNKQCKNFTSAIAENERVKLETKMKNAKFLSVMCDETTDTSVSEQVIVFVRLASAGVIKTHFVAVRHVKKADSSSVFHCLIDILKEYCGLNEQYLTEHLVGFASDGASVMVGINSGVQAKLKTIQPHLWSVHCVAHRLELALKDAVLHNTYSGKLESFLNSIYVLFHQSPNHRSILRNSCEAANIPFCVPTRIGGTRWLEYTRNALVNVLKLKPALLICLEDISSGANSSLAAIKSKALLKQIKDSQFFLFMNFLCDVLNILVTLSHAFQNEKATISDVNKNLNDCVTSLKSLSDKSGYHLRNAENLLQDKSLSLQTVIKEETISKIVSCLQKRLGKNQRNSAEAELYGAAKLFNFKTWPSKEDKKFGSESIIKLITLFSVVLLKNNIKCELVESEWISLRSSIYEEYHPISQASWEDVNHKHLIDCPNILALVDLILTLPAHTADCERGFSIMKRVKSDWRSSLNDQTLTGLLRIQMESPPVHEFNPDQAILLWNSSSIRKRRPFQTPYGHRTSHEKSVTDDDMSDSSLSS